uniref:Uncharacterized protein n=1 Tax=Romanomermis culicivorax TaxID=13658 RepID=A0A915HN07_ROMCU
MLKILSSTRAARPSPVKTRRLSNDTKTYQNRHPAAEFINLYFQFSKLTNNNSRSEWSRCKKRRKRIFRSKKLTKNFPRVLTKRVMKTAASLAETGAATRAAFQTFFAEFIVDGFFLLVRQNVVSFGDFFEFFFGASRFVFVRVSESKNTKMLDMPQNA